MTASKIEKKCEYCNILFLAFLKHHNRGQARFCNKICADKASKQTHSIICKICGIEFYVFSKQKFRKTCSRKCLSEINRTIESREKASLAAIKRIGDNKNIERLKSIVCEYIFNNKKIRCDSKAEYSCLNYIENNYNVLDIDRSSLVLQYQLDGYTRRYNPDFIIKLTDNKILIAECKTVLSNKDLQQKWGIYYKSIKPKKKALEKYCKDNNFEVLFYHKDMNSSYYNSISRQQLQSVVSPEVKTPL